MEKKGRTEEKIKFFYNLGADASFEFRDEEPIPVTKSIIAFHSQTFRNAFFGPEPKTHIKVQSFDRETFKMFLDCLLGFKEYSLLDALIIYPIAKEYDVTESLEKCVAALKPEIMDENVAHVLNLSAFYEDDYLTDYVINFIKTKYGMIKFLKSEKYSGSLDPLAICKILDTIDLNSLVWTLVYKWAENYLKEGNKSDLKFFFKKNGILEKISVFHFESAKAVRDFHILSDMKLFSAEKIFRFFAINMYETPKTIPDKSDWFKIDPGFEFSEMIVFRHFFPAYHASNLDIIIHPNQILFDLEAFELKIDATYIFRHVASCKDPEPDLIWSDDLHFFCRETWPESLPEDFIISALCRSDEFEVNLVDGGKDPFYKFSVKTGHLGTEFFAVEVTYKFKSSCWILKASLDIGEYSVDKNNLYFTKNVAINKKNKA